MVQCSVLCYLGHCIGDFGSSHRSAPPALDRIRIDLVSIIVVVSIIVIVMLIAMVVITLHTHVALV